MVPFHSCQTRASVFSVLHKHNNHTTCEYDNESSNVGKNKSSGHQQDRKGNTLSISLPQYSEAPMTFEAVILEGPCRAVAVRKSPVH